MASGPVDLIRSCVHLGRRSFQFSPSDCRMKEYTVGNVVRAGLVGALVGTAAGFALGLLLAPEEGQKIRRRVVYQLENLAGQVGEFVDNIVNPEIRGDARLQATVVGQNAASRSDDLDTARRRVAHADFGQYTQRRVVHRRDVGLACR